MISVVFLSVFVFLIAGLMILAGASFAISNPSLNELWEEESWAEPVAYALVACLAALLLSFVNIRVIDSPTPISLNFTGVIIPLSLSSILVVLRKVRLLPLAISVLVVGVFGYFVTTVEPGGIMAYFPFWLIPLGMAAWCGYHFSQKKSLMEMASLCYVAGSLGMFMGGDIAHVLTSAGLSGNGIVLGAGGMLDFVFLSGILSIALLWSGRAAFATLKRLLSELTIRAKA